MYHGPVVCSVYGLADTGFLAFHQAQFVHSVIHPKRNQFVPWEPLPENKRGNFQIDQDYTNVFILSQPVWILPSSFGVKEEHQEELFAPFRFPPVSKFKHLHRRHWNRDAVMKKPFLGHVWVNNL